MTRAIDLQEKQTYQLLWLSHGGGDEFFTDWTSDVSYQGNTYLSRPTLEIKLPKNTGTLEDIRCTIEMTVEDGVLTNLTSGDQHAEVEVTVYEKTIGTGTGPSGSTKTTFLGRVVLGTRNVNGKRGTVKLHCAPDKAMMNVAMGEQINHFCRNALGDGRCQINMDSGVNSFFGTITAMTDRTLTISIGGTVTNTSLKYFHRGTIAFAGMRMLIRDWNSSDPETFLMVRRPPAAWLGQSVFISSGCDKSLQTCIDRYDNEEHFRGNGFAIPSHNPWTELG